MRYLATVIVLATLSCAFPSAPPVPLSKVPSVEGIQLAQDAGTLLERMAASGKSFVPGEVPDIPGVDAKVFIWKNFDTGDTHVFRLDDCAQLELDGHLLFDLKENRITYEQLITALAPATHRARKLGENSVTYLTQGGNLIFEFDERDYVTQFHLIGHQSPGLYTYTSLNKKTVQSNDPRLRQSSNN